MSALFICFAVFGGFLGGVLIGILLEQEQSIRQLNQIIDQNRQILRASEVERLLEDLRLKRFGA